MKRTFPAALILSVCLICLRSPGFVVIVNDPGDQILCWHPTWMPVNYWIDYNIVDYNIPSSHYTAIQNAFASWQNAAGCNLVFNYAGYDLLWPMGHFWPHLVAPIDPEHPDVTLHGNGYNQIIWAGGDGGEYWCENLMQYPPIPCNGDPASFPNNVPSWTRIYYEYDTADNAWITETDTLLNEEYFNFTSTGQAGYYLDLQSVMAHEVGHWLGLGNQDLGPNPDPATTMYPGFAWGDTSKRSPEADDIDGVQFLYSGGLLKVYLVPATAVAAGAQWRVDYGAWRDSGERATCLSQGWHTVDFKAVNGYTTPAPLVNAVPIDPYYVTEVTGNYGVAVGNLKVNLGPSAVLDAGARWKADDGEWRASGDTQYDLEVGVHTIHFRPVEGWEAPPAYPVTIVNNSTAEVSFTYTNVPAGEYLVNSDDNRVDTHFRYDFVGSAVWLNAGNEYLLVGERDGIVRPPAPWHFYYETFIVFPDLSMAPTAEETLHAEMELYLTEAIGFTEYIRMAPITAAWTGSQSTKPGVGTFSNVSIPPSSPGWYSIDVTDLYKTQWRHGSANYGIALDDTTNSSYGVDSYVAFAGGGYWDAARRPRLRITMQPMGTISAVIAPPAAIEAGALWRIDTQPTWHESGEVVDVTQGAHSIYFLPVDNFITPTGQSVSVGATPANVTATYTAVGPGQFLTQPSPQATRDKYFRLPSTLFRNNETLQVGHTIVTTQQWLTTLLWHPWLGGTPGAVGTQKAELEFWCSTRTGSPALQLGRVTGGWSEGGIDIPTGPEDLRSCPPPAGGSRWWKTDVTDFYEGWKNGSFSNYGVGIGGTETGGGNNYLSLRSSDYVDPAYWPRLRITYDGYQRLRHNDFATDTTSPSPGDTTGWTPFSPNEEKDTVRASYKRDNGSLELFVLQDAAPRINGWMSGNSDWLPYSSVGAGNYVRGRFVVAHALQSSPTDMNQIPNMRLRVACRFAMNSMLEIFNHLGGDVTGTDAGREIRPGEDVNTPAVYRVDLDPVDVPAMGNAGEGILRGFEVYSLESQENGALYLLESEIGVYPALPDAGPDVLATKIFQVSATDAGDLKAFNSLTDGPFRSKYIVYSPGVFGPQALLDGVTDPTYSQTASGITLGSTSVATNRLGIVVREFTATGSNPARLRVEPGKQYKVKWHVTSNTNAGMNPQMRMRARALKFMWSQKYEIGGAYGAGSANNTIAQQALPGVGTQNPDKLTPGENGGWYTLLMHTPMSPDLRLDQPYIESLPGPGSSAASSRDIKYGFDLLDTLSGSEDSVLESGRFTLDRIEVRVYDLIGD